MSAPMIVGFSDAELNRFQSQINQFTAKKTKQIKDLVTRTGLNMRDKAFMTCPKHFGVLRNSLRHVTSSKGLSVRVGTAVNYAPYVEFGTKSKVQVPDELKEFALQFRTSAPGASGGMAARPYLYPAFKSEQPIFMQKLKAIFNAV